MFATLNFKSLFLISGSIDLSMLGYTTMREVTYWMQQNHPSRSPQIIWLLVSPLLIPTPEWAALSSFCASGERTNTDNGVRSSSGYSVILNLAFRAGQAVAPLTALTHAPGLGSEPLQLGWVGITALQIQTFKWQELYSKCAKMEQAPLFLIRVWQCHYESFFIA